MKCPACNRDSLEIKKPFFGKEYARCTRLFCNWDSRSAETERRKAKERRKKQELDDKIYRVWQTEQRYKEENN